MDFFINSRLIVNFLTSSDFTIPLTSVDLFFLFIVSLLLN